MNKLAKTKKNHIRNKNKIKWEGVDVNIVTVKIFIHNSYMFQIALQLHNLHNV